MKIAMQLDYSGGFKASADRVVEYEKAGLDIVWVAEAYGFDAPSLMGYLAHATERVEIGAGILPIYTRTPTLIAMTAAGVDAMTDGRCILGLGASGPQVIEGWHGVPYDAPIGRTREIIEICRDVWKREDRLTYDGRYYQLPLPEGQGHRTRQAAQDHRPPRTRCDPDLRRVTRREERADDRAARRRVAADLLHPREGTRRVGLGPRQGLRQARRVARTTRDRRRRHGEHHRRPDADPRHGAWHGGAVHRWDGRARSQLLQPARDSLRLRRRSQGDPGPVSRRPQDRSRGARCPSSSSSCRTWSDPRATSRTGSPPSRRAA